MEEYTRQIITDHIRYSCISYFKLKRRDFHVDAETSEITLSFPAKQIKETIHGATYNLQIDLLSNNISNGGPSQEAVKCARS